MKTLFNIFLLLAVAAFTTDVVYTFAKKNTVESISKQADADDEEGSDPDDTSKTTEEEEEGEPAIKELICEGFLPFEFETQTISVHRKFRELPDCCEFHLTNPPYSPPEVV